MDYSHSSFASLSLGYLVGLYEHLHAVSTNDPYFLGAANDGPALGAYPPPGAALGLWRLGCTCLAAARCLAAVASANHISPRQPLTHLDVLPAHENDEVQQLFGGACDCPAVFSMVLHRQPVCLSMLLKAPVVIDPVVAGILDDGLHAVLVHHLMQQGGGGLLDGTVKGSRRNIDLILVLAACLPDLGAGDVTIGGVFFFRLMMGSGSLPAK